MDTLFTEPLYFNKQVRDVKELIFNSCKQLSNYQPISPFGPYQHKEVPPDYMFIKLLAEIPHIKVINNTKYTGIIEMGYSITEKETGEVISLIKSTSPLQNGYFISNLNEDLSEYSKALSTVSQYAEVTLHVYSVLLGTPYVEMIIGTTVRMIENPRTHLCTRWLKKIKSILKLSIWGSNWKEEFDTLWARAHNPFINGNN